MFLTEQRLSSTGASLSYHGLFKNPCVPGMLGHYRLKTRQPVKSLGVRPSFFGCHRLMSAAIRPYLISPSPSLSLHRGRGIKTSWGLPYVFMDVTTRATVSSMVFGGVWLTGCAGL